MKVAAVVIVYKSNIEEVQTNIEQFILSVDKLIIWRNSPETIAIAERYLDKVVFMGLGNNEFIAKPLNTVVEWCHENEFDWLLTMDQDSTWANFDGFWNTVKHYTDTDVVIYAPNVNSTIQEDEPRVAVKSVITSGSLYCVKKLRQLGGFREDYQIYWVDGEFCYWAGLHQYKIYVLPNFNLTQKFGKETTGAFGVFVANYTAIVYYYLFRNMLWMRREYGEGVSIKTIFYTSKIYILGIIVGESQKLTKLRMVFKAFYEGLFSRIETRRK